MVDKNVRLNRPVFRPVFYIFFYVNSICYYFWYLLGMLHRFNISQNVFYLLVINKFAVNHSRPPMKDCERKEKILAAFLAKMLFFFRFFFLNHRLIKNRISRLMGHRGYSADQLPPLFNLLFDRFNQVVQKRIAYYIVFH